MMQSSQIMKCQTTRKRKRTATPIIPATRTTTTTMLLLDEIIFFHILPKLPATSLHICSCVSKLWYNTIHDPKFIATHLKSNPSLVALLGYQHRFLRFLHLEGGGGGHASLDLRLLSSGFTITGYCNGLTCSKCSSYIHISNPSTRELLTFPRPSLSPLTRTNYFNFRVGLGFDPVMNEYKVVHISFDHQEYYEIWVYTLGTNSWRNITATCNYSPSHFPFSLEPVSTGGAVYWMTMYGNLLSFDLHLEKFQVVPCPKPPPRGPGFRWLGLFVLEGCPSLIFRCDDDSIKDGGVQLIIYTLTNHGHRRLRVMHTEQQQQQQASSSSSSSSSSRIWVRFRNCIRLPFKPDTEMIRVIVLSKKLYLQWNTRDGDFIWYNVSKKIIQKKLSGLDIGHQVLLVNHVVNLLSLKTFVPSPSPGDFKVKYVSSRKAKHASPTETSFCSDLRSLQRDKKWRKGATPGWFPIMF